MFGKFLSLAKAVKKIKPRITPGTAFLFIFFALAVDLVQILVNFLDEVFGIGIVINWLIDIAMGFTLWFLFRINRIKFIQISADGTSSAKGLIAFLIVFIIKLIPVLNALPAWTLDTFINIGVSWAEDLAAQEKSGALASTLPGGRKALSEGAKKQALQARKEDRRDGTGRYGPNGEEKNPEREDLKKGADDYYDKLAEEHMNPSQLQEYRGNQQKVDGISAPSREPLPSESQSPREPLPSEKPEFREPLPSEK